MCLYQDVGFPCYMLTKLSADLISSVAEGNLKQMGESMLFYYIAARESDIYMKY